MNDITLLLHAAESGEPLATEKLLPLVYDELRRLANRRLGRKQQPGMTILQPTALVHEAWLRLAHQTRQGWVNRQHFFRAAALAMRHIMVDLARKRSTQKREHESESVDVVHVNLINPEPDQRVLMVQEALVQLEAEDPSSAQIITYKFFGGFSNQETARMMGISERTLNRQWAYAKACIYRILKNRSETAMHLSTA